MENNYKGLLDKEFILNIFDDNMSLATRKFIEFNEENSNNKCLEDDRRKRLSDDEARKEILKLISVEELTGFKNMNGSERNEKIKVVKTVRHMTQRQAARILGISPNLVFKN
jgi:flagellar motility protein MotE (MotC chaperone)